MKTFAQSELREVLTSIEMIDFHDTLYIDVFERRQTAYFFKFSYRILMKAEAQRRA